MVKKRLAPLDLIIISFYWRIIHWIWIKLKMAYSKDQLKKVKKSENARRKKIKEKEKKQNRKEEQKKLR